MLGATGFIGGQVARAALAHGWQVSGMRRRAGATGDLADADLAWVDGDLLDPGCLRGALQAVDVVFHCAGYYPSTSASVEEHLRLGLEQTEAVLKAMKHRRSAQLVYTSSLSTLGWPTDGADREVNESDAYEPGTLPRSAYYEVKAAMEHRVLQAAAEGLRVVVLNPTAVFGPGDVHLTTGKVLLLAARGWARIAVAAKMNVVDVREVAYAHLAATEVESSGERFILGGTNLTVRAFLSQAAATAGAPGPVGEIPPAWLAWTARLLEAIPATAAAGGHLRAMRTWPAYDSRKAQHRLGLRPRPLQATLDDAYAWLEARGHLRRRTMV